MITPPPVGFVVELRNCERSLRYEVKLTLASISGSKILCENHVSCIQITSKCVVARKVFNEAIFELAPDMFIRFVSLSFFVAVDFGRHLVFPFNTSDSHLFNWTFVVQRSVCRIVISSKLIWFETIYLAIYACRSRIDICTCFGLMCHCTYFAAYGVRTAQRKVPVFLAAETLKCLHNFICLMTS